MRTLRAITLAALVACAAAASLQPPRAQAYSLLGRYWNDPVITYYASSARERSASAFAARTWNRAGTGFRFRRTTSARRAGVVVGTGGEGCGGVAILGGRQARVRLGRCGERLTRLVATHEFGHVLGFGHERRRCALMNTYFDQTGTPALCNRRPLSFWLADPLRADDERGARALRRLR